MEINVTRATTKLADSINSKRRSEIMSVYQNKDVWNYINELRKNQVYAKGNRSKSMRLVASIPFTVDQFFSKIYGEDYFKDPEFFTKRYSEWNVNEYNRGELEESQANVKEMFERGKENDKNLKLDATREH